MTAPRLGEWLPAVAGLAALLLSAFAALAREGEAPQREDCRPVPGLMCEIGGGGQAIPACMNGGTIMVCEMEIGEPRVVRNPEFGGEK